MNNRIFLGTSFSPEQAESIGCNKPIQLLKIILKDLGIKEIRLGLRWNQIDHGDKKISIVYYKPYLNYLIQNDCPICLNIGPIKTFRWPEEHLPEYLQKYASKKIDVKSELSQRAYDYLHQLLDQLSKEYPYKLQNITFQLDNEAFNKFGQFKMEISENHVLKTIEILHNHFPQAKLMLNSAGRMDLNQIVKIFQQLIKIQLYKPQYLTAGFNYYFKIPQTLPFFKILNPLKISYPFNMTISSFQKNQQKIGFELEVSEGQFEPWGIQTSPGNSFPDFEYMIQKSTEIFPINYPHKLIRLWGTELFAWKFLNKTDTEEHQKILEEIRKINRN
ncbi:hypothetical protein A2X44_03245 [candidate division CPR3 bacterium GWF2_35_18]|uniref:Glycoside hydrolase family 42 N-terminal domain-containing protein n=1 Tax=candidate division CPR3 bacterium GW2011_GWF2_35_18 TaxID=1618350 RepID=A0A0G0C0B7_UNCC3|nr:MAG: hypothetical protein UR67_C0005G0020 [candidate division CPR3 bacterium GW2011_GWF2_35_18]KKP85355.1 MAG: hypothetical protein UR87_C0054G0004 [candidate division CPR3 bacterium GW2011_GWE2_35_7]OGB63000.1 MAG: hypothetical protein A2X44_03245 [candidate division CPR3 bacterium GWF2_35_18]OGB63976.1 MAG: hypothetical protein A2250_02960 [candidate division CPR3 bacterium RIFOXYA2_FULL_35_13]OGB78428.1 MAG: hypothetical protein A2296_03640 [candidate division CPR3 bacterium RIFOXYB2_FULL